MWIEYKVITPYGEPQIRYFETNQETIDEALFDLGCAVYHAGTISSVCFVERPSVQHCRELLFGLSLKLEAIQQEINKIQGYLNDSSE